MTSTTPEAPVTGMFSNLTRGDLSELHAQLGEQHTAILHEMFTDTWEPRARSAAEWTEIKAREADVYEQMSAVFAELRRRDSEPAPHDDGTSYCTSIPGGCPVGDLDKYPLTGVPMVCTACRKPVEPARKVADSVPGARGWQHTTDSDAIGCPASGSVVKAMVAEGNENVPRG